MNVSLVNVCVECGEVRHVPFAALSSHDALARHLGADGWFLSVVTPPGEPDVVMACLCGACAPKVHHPGVIEMASAVLAGGRS